MRILFLTTNNLTTNPRLLKEVKLALESGFIPTVVLFDFDNWTTDIEKKIRASLKGVEFISITATRKAFQSWLLATGFQLLYRKLYKLLPFSVKVDAYASDKRSYLLEHRIHKLHSNFDLIISHNLGSLYPAYAFAISRNLPFAFDVEDYHPGETVTKDIKQEIARRTNLMKKLLPKASYISYASPLIGKASLDLVPELQEKAHLLVNNSFPSLEFLQPVPIKGDKLRFIWFSQNITAGRGLELVVPVLHKYRAKVQLTLIGNLVPSFRELFLKQYDELIIYVKPLAQQALHHELAKYDVALAVEISNADLNKDIAYSNKIFAYAQAGLYIMATDTRAQIDFMNQNSFIGQVFSQTITDFDLALKKLLENREKVIAAKQQRYELGKNLSWDKEAVKLLATWNDIS